MAIGRVDDLTRLDELAFAVGKSVRPHISIEARLYYALEMHYGVHCPQRFRNLIEALDRARGHVNLPEDSLERGAPHHSETPFPRPDHTRHRFVRRIRAPTQRSIPLSEEERRVLETGEDTSTDAVDPAAPRNPAPSSSGALTSADTSSKIGRLLVNQLGEHLVRTVLFRVNRQLVTGWMGAGPNLDREPTVFRDVERNGTFRGALSASPHHESLARCWGGGLGHECLVLPIRGRKRMIGAAYGDRGALGLASIDIVAAERLAARAGLAFERLILDRKLRE